MFYKNRFSLSQNFFIANKKIIIIRVSFEFYSNLQCIEKIIYDF